MQVAVRDLTRHLHLLGVGGPMLSLRDPWSAKDAGEWSPVEPRVFDVVGPAKIGYAPGLSEAARHLTFKGFDLIHLHGLWQFPSKVAYDISKGTGAPRVISPHGMLDPWALRRSSRKKLLARWLWENANVRTAQCLHALSEAEYRAIREFGGRGPVAVIPNGVTLTEDTGDTRDPAPEAWRGKRILLYLSRIHPKKGLAPLLDAWHDIGTARQGWKLVIAGPDEVGHLAELTTLTDRLAIADDVLFPGPVYGNVKESWFRRADAFVLPSFSEGFPMAVLEAMAHSLPVVLTPYCNLPAAEFSGATLVAEPAPQSLGGTLRQLVALTDPERQEMGKAGRTIVGESYRWDLIAGRMKAVYEWLIGRGPIPPDVRTD